MALPGPGERPGESRVMRTGRAAANLYKASDVVGPADDEPRVRSRVADRFTNRSDMFGLMSEMRQGGGSAIGADITPPPPPGRDDDFEVPPYGSGGSGPRGTAPGTSMFGGPALDRGQAPFIGVPEGYGTHTAARYMEGDEYRPAGWSVERIARLQRRMVKAGLMTSAFALGVWDQTSSDAYSYLLALSNQVGKEATGLLRRFEANPLYEAPEFQAPAFLKPDKAALASSVEDAFEALFKREPTAREVAEYAKFLTQQYRKIYRREVEDARYAYELETMTGAERSLAVEDDSLPAPPPMEVASAVDPGARLEERLEDDYEDELDLLARRETGARNVASLSDSFDKLLSQIGSL